MEKEIGMKLGAVDIGSNAVRCQISNVVQQGNNINFKKVEYVRYALRLGEDVFKDQIISPKKEEKLCKLIEAFSLLFDVYDVQASQVCATSAMREAHNGVEVAARIKEKTGITIDVISGDQEAELINDVIFTNMDNWNYLHIDVGGGSTELNVYRNKEKVASRSFRLGSVRCLQSGREEKDWDEMRDWIHEHVKNKYGPIVAIGTGGNIGKLYEMAKIKQNEPIGIKKLQELKNYIEKYPLAQRISELMLNPDRADVIIPASEIYISAMEWAGSEKMMVPDVGLKDGIIQALYRRMKG